MVRRTRQPTPALCTVATTLVPVRAALLRAYLCIEGEGARGNLRQRQLRLRQAVGTVAVGHAQQSIVEHLSHDAASEGDLLAGVPLAQAGAWPT